MSEEIITTIGVYNNGDKVINGVRASHIEVHIDYNKKFRPGRALFVNGVCKHTGYLGKERCKELEIEFKDIKKDKDTAPYI